MQADIPLPYFDCPNAVKFDSPSLARNTLHAGQREQALIRRDNTQPPSPTTSTPRNTMISSSQGLLLFAEPFASSSETSAIGYTIVRPPCGQYPEGRFRAIRLGGGESCLGRDLVFALVCNLSMNSRNHPPQLRLSFHGYWRKCPKPSST